METRRAKPLAYLFEVIFFLRVIPDSIKIWLLRFSDYFRQHPDQPNVTIVVPTYNRSDLFLSRTLPSLLNQDYSPIQIIVVGDCCDEYHASNLRRASEDGSFTFINLKKRGSYPTDIKLRWFVAGSAPMNAGIARAPGQWICHCDDDDIFHSDHVSTLLGYAVKNNLEFVSGGYYEADFELNVKKIVYPYKQSRLWTSIIYGGHSTILYRSWLRHFHYSSFSYLKSWNRPSDIDRLFRLCYAGTRIGSLHRIVTTIASRTSSSSSVGLAQHYDESLDD